jgi:hypothetical protein
MTSHLTSEMNQPEIPKLPRLNLAKEFFAEQLLERMFLRAFDQIPLPLCSRAESTELCRAELVARKDELRASFSFKNDEIHEACQVILPFLRQDVLLTPEQELEIVYFFETGGHLERGRVDYPGTLDRSALFALAAAINSKGT